MGHTPCGPIARMRIQTIKRAVLNATKRTGLLSAVGRSPWRARRLLILCYHGVSQHDEHLWNPTLYVSQDALRRRMELLIRNDCSVLSLEEALARLGRHDLPPRSVAITFDDGNYDFVARAYPVIQAFRFPVTVYQTSYYCTFNRPVFDVACSYILWKGAGKTVDGTVFTGAPGVVDLSTEEGRATASRRIREAAERNGLSAAAKDELLDRLAASLDVDSRFIRANRLLHLMNPAEVQALIRDGIDMQLHTHRHRMPTDRDGFFREIEDNRRFLASVGQSSAKHFCYPSGIYGDRFLPWLTALGVQSATTCDTGLTNTRTRALLLPRLVDAQSLSDLEFEGWVHGVSHLLPRRPPRYRYQQMP